MPDRLTEAWYDPDHEVRHVDKNGTITWRGKAIFISEALARQKIALLEHECGGYLVRFYNRDLGLIDQTGKFHRAAQPRTRRSEAVELAETKEQ
jgi:hypothetical protein